MKFLELIRYKNLLIILFVQACAYVFLNGFECIMPVFHIRIELLMLSTMLIAAAGYLINDYSDVKIDVVNKPERLIVSRFISRRAVLIIYILFNVIGLAAGAYISRFFGLIELFIVFILWQYSVRFKYYFISGNLLVAMLMALSVLVVYFAQKDILLDWLLFYTFFAFLTGFIREIVKDIEDLEGDAQYGAQTMPNVLGLYKTKMVLYYILALLIVLLLFACGYLVYREHYTLTIYLVLLIIIPTIILWVFMVKAHKKTDFAKLSTSLKLIMLAGIVSMALRCLP